MCGAGETINAAVLTTLVGIDGEVKRHIGGVILRKNASRVFLSDRHWLRFAAGVFGRTPPVILELDSRGKESVVRVGGGTAPFDTHGSSSMLGTESKYQGPVSSSAA